MASGAGAEGAGAVDDLGDDPLVAEVDAVEVADGGDAGLQCGWEFARMAVDAASGGLDLLSFLDISKLSWRPS